MTAPRPASSFLRAVLGFGCGALCAVLLPPALEALAYLRSGHAALAPTARPESLAAVDDPINPAWIVEGSPRFQTTPFYRSADGGVSAGLWEATGPARFEWHYGTDETVLILEGGARLTHGGQTYEVSAGSRVFFRNGETVLWEVPDRIRKTWVLHDPGRVVRRLRPLLPDAPAGAAGP